MGLPDIQVRRAAAIDAQFRTYGEPVTLPGGVEVEGIFWPMGEAAGGVWGSEVGLAGRLSAQPNPVLLLRGADAAGVVDKTALSVRETEYVVAGTPDTDFDGRVWCKLMPASRGLDDDTARYR